MQLFKNTLKNEGGGEELALPKLIDYDGKQVCPEHFKVLNESGIKAKDIETNKLGEVVSLTLDFEKLAAWLNNKETFKEKINPIAETFSSLEKLTLKTGDYNNQMLCWFSVKWTFEVLKKATIIA